MTEAVLTPFELVEDRAVGPVAQRYRDRLLARVNETPSSLDSLYQEVLQTLDEVANEASTPGWDGYEAVPVSEATLCRARELLAQMMPKGFQKPEVSAHPDGEIAFEWYFGPRRVLTVAIGETGRVSYAALIGQTRQHGMEFLSDEFPSSIAEAYWRTSGWRSAARYTA